MDARFRDELAAAAGEVLFDEPLAPYTSMGVGGKAEALAFPSGEDALGRTVSLCRERGVAWFPAGNWTNLIVADEGWRGVVVALKNLRQVNLVRNAGGGARIEAGAGAPLAETVALAAREALTGLEFGAGIPGSVGGAVRMNAGAFGREMKDVVESVRLLDESGRFREAAGADLPFAYRNLDLPPGSVITGARFRLEEGNGAAVRRKIAEIMALRRQKHPLEHRSAGSVFKNPRGIPAGRLIEEAGLKGTRIGDAQVSEKHGNFIVNLGKARAGDVLALIDLVRERVREKTGVILETEVRIVGSPS
ncbi:MAG: UDP-N-acetylmuramate dehydrogenase [Syntrophaceae bacterium]|nr:UDP-N-acetylmuramate dehydrogenase [Syntrophaceae bacterium]